jgi:hypothetical protein
VTGRRKLAAAFSATLEINEIRRKRVLLPVTIRGEVPGRALRGGRDVKLMMR